MALVAERITDSRTQQLRDLIEVLVAVVKRHDGVVSQRVAMQEAAREARMSIAEMPYIVNSAVADNRITADLRSGKLELVS